MRSLLRVALTQPGHSLRKRSRGIEAWAQELERLGLSHGSAASQSLTSQVIYHLRALVSWVIIAPAHGVVVRVK